jgi:hypothetical protein
VEECWRRLVARLGRVIYQALVVLLDRRFTTQNELGAIVREPACTLLLELTAFKTCEIAVWAGVRDRIALTVDWDYVVSRQGCRKARCALIAGLLLEPTRAARCV